MRGDIIMLVAEQLNSWSDGSNMWKCAMAKPPLHMRFPNKLDKEKSLNRHNTDDSTVYEASYISTFVECLGYARSWIAMMAT